MPIDYSHKCNKCGYSVITSAEWEFYRDSEGKRKGYGHPIPASLEAAEAGIYGYDATVYCSNCDQTFNIILREYKKPYFEKKRGFLWTLYFFDFLPRFMGRIRKTAELKDEYKKEGAVKCPKCGNVKLVQSEVFLNDIRIVICPRCKEGKLIPQKIATY